MALSLSTRISACAAVLGSLILAAIPTPGFGQAGSAPTSEQGSKEVALSREAAEAEEEELWQAHIETLRQSRQAEWDAKSIQLDDLTMKFDFRVFGDAPEGGRSLFLSMHGGGNAPARVNEQQWRNQIGLYEPDEGVYLAPRAPTNTWNLWHEPHIDRFLVRIIEDAVLFENVDPNRVYLMGYSAGGDGVYQLAPRMADRLAAAAMMAGHPNDASPLGLRNIGFTLHMGGDDSAYDRNKVAAAWKTKLAELQKADPDGYPHEVVIHEGKGHWMDREDAVALSWMARFTRNPWPRKVVWHQSSVTHDAFYWLGVDDANRRKGTTVVASIESQVIQIEQAKGIGRLTLYLNDDLIDLDQPIVIRFDDQELFQGKLERKREHLAASLKQRGDRNFMFPAVVTVDLPMDVK